MYGLLSYYKYKKRFKLKYWILRRKCREFLNRNRDKIKDAKQRVRLFLRRIVPEILIFGFILDYIWYAFGGTFSLKHIIAYGFIYYMVKEELSFIIRKTFK